MARPRLLFVLVSGILLHGCRNRPERKTPPTGTYTPSPSATAQQPRAPGSGSAVTIDSGSTSRVLDIQAGAEGRTLLTGRGRTA